ncbi:hypothetical protein CEY17_02775 [Corynebacterium glutamicum ATCC 14067]|nr:hypothetical protein CEY17_02775 [Corynebacterium glutamicum ATCC 14067]
MGSGVCWGRRCLKFDFTVAVSQLRFLGFGFSTTVSLAQFLKSDFSRFLVVLRMVSSLKNWI